MGQLLRAVRPAEAYFWATHRGSELDPLLMLNGLRYGVEVKFNETPKVTRSMRITIGDLKVYHLWVVYPGIHTYPVDQSITVLPRPEVTEFPRLIG